MKNLFNWSLSLGTLTAIACSAITFAQQPMMNNNGQNNGMNAPSIPSYNSQNQPALRIGIVNTKKCLEQSKLGKQETANFEKMKQQMESVLQEKERTLEEIQSKLDDDDYMDSVSDETASDLNRRKKSIQKEGMQIQNQYMQTLQQANVKVIQKLTDAISKASAQVAADTANGAPIDVIFTDEACTFYAPALDVSDRVIAKMNSLSDADLKESSFKPAR